MNGKAELRNQNNAQSAKGMIGIRKKRMIKMDGMKMINICFVVFLLFGVLVIVTMIVDQFYVMPLAAEKANTYCRNNGFDQHKTFSRVGLLSEEPVGIKCEYAEKYTDLGIRSNS